MKRPGAGPGLSRLLKSPQACLRSAAALIGTALSLHGPSRLIGNPHGELGNALVSVDHLLQGVAHQIALNRDEVLHRTGACNPAHRVDVLLHTILDETEHLMGDL